MSCCNLDKYTVLFTYWRSNNTQGYVRGDVFPIIQKIVRLTPNAINPDTATIIYNITLSMNTCSKALGNLIFLNKALEFIHLLNCKWMLQNIKYSNQSSTLCVPHTSTAYAKI